MHPKKSVGDREVYRTFCDTHGAEWKVWEVIPLAETSRRPGMVPPDQATSFGRSEQGRRDRGVERQDRWKQGWLLFESKGDRRRLRPIPEDWEDASDHALQEWCAQALKVEPSED